MPLATRLPLPFLLLLLAASCVGRPARLAAPDAQGSKQDKAAKRAADLEQAQLALRIAGLEGEAGERAAAVVLEEAQHEVSEAELALARFDEYERPTRLAEGRLSVDRGELSVSQDEAELQQMEEMYAAETNLDATGERTRDLVLERHRKALEFSRRQLELAREGYRDQEERELPRKRRELEQGLAKAREGLRKAQAKAEQGARGRQLALLKARSRVEELEREASSAAGGEGGGSGDGAAAGAPR